MAKFVAPVPNVAIVDMGAYGEMLQFARDIRYGKVKDATPEQKAWAKSITFAEAYSMGPRPLKELLVRVPRKTPPRS